MNLELLFDSVIAEAIADKQESIPTLELPSVKIIVDRIAELEDALQKAREDINWMLNSQQLLNPFVFDYIDKVLDKLEN